MRQTLQHNLQHFDKSSFGEECFDKSSYDAFVQFCFDHFFESPPKFETHKTFLVESLKFDHFICDFIIQASNVLHQIEVKGDSVELTRYPTDKTRSALLLFSLYFKHTYPCLGKDHPIITKFDECLSIVKGFACGPNLHRTGRYTESFYLEQASILQITSLHSLSILLLSNCGHSICSDSEVFDKILLPIFANPQTSIYVRSYAVQFLCFYLYATSLNSSAFNSFLQFCNSLFKTSINSSSLEPSINSALPQSAATKLASPSLTSSTSLLEFILYLVQTFCTLGHPKEDELSLSGSRKFSYLIFPKDGQCKLQGFLINLFQNSKLIETYVLPIIKDYSSPNRKTAIDILAFLSQETYFINFEKEITALTLIGSNVSAVIESYLNLIENDVSQHTLQLIKSINPSQFISCFGTSTEVQGFISRLKNLLFALNQLWNTTISDNSSYQLKNAKIIVDLLKSVHRIYKCIQATKRNEIDMQDFLEITKAGTSLIFVSIETYKIIYKPVLYECMDCLILFNSLLKYNHDTELFISTGQKQIILKLAQQQNDSIVFFKACHFIYGLSGEDNPVMRQKLVDILKQCLFDLNWEIRDSCLQFISSDIICHDETIIDNTFIQLICQKLQDSENYVRLSALNVIDKIVDTSMGAMDMENLTIKVLQSIKNSNEYFLKVSGFGILTRWIDGSFINLSLCSHKSDFSEKVKLLLKEEFEYIYNQFEYDLIPSALKLQLSMMKHFLKSIPSNSQSHYQHFEILERLFSNEFFLIRFLQEVLENVSFSRKHNQSMIETVRDLWHILKEHVKKENISASLVEKLHNLGHSPQSTSREVNGEKESNPQEIISFFVFNEDNLDCY